MIASIILRARESFASESQNAQELAGLAPRHQRAKQCHEREAHPFDLQRQRVHGGGRGPQDERYHAHDRDRDERLDERCGKAQSEAFAKRFFVGHDIGGDHGLAVPRPGRMKDPVGEAEPEQGAERVSVVLQTADRRL